MSRETAHEYEESPDQKSKCFQEGRSAVSDSASRGGRWLRKRPARCGQQEVVTAGVLGSYVCAEKGRRGQVPVITQREEG